jgi:hypothetical protein
MTKLIVSDKYTDTKGKPLIISINPLVIKMMRQSRRMAMGLKKVPLNTTYTFTTVGTTTFTVEQTGYYNLKVHGGGGGGGGTAATYFYVTEYDYWNNPIQVEHGNGKRGSGGGGSGNSWTRVFLTKGQVVTVTVGAGGAAGVGAFWEDVNWNLEAYLFNTTRPTTAATAGSQGGYSAFGDYVVQGGLGGSTGNYGTASALPPGGSNQGNISSSGSNGAIVSSTSTYTSTPGVAGGQGDTGNPSATYGDGGKGGGSATGYDVHMGYYMYAGGNYQSLEGIKGEAATAGSNGAVILTLASYS